jgi:predicted RNA-binding Zn ribbon-like protein
VARSNEAPGDLALVRAFVNTLDIEDEVEELDSPEAAARWLTEQGLLQSGDVDEASFRRLIAVREALRDLLLANNDGHTPDPAAVAALREAGARAPLALEVRGDGGIGLAPAVSGVDAALARLLAIVYGATASGDWSRLKVCRSAQCRWAFYDHSRNHSAHWCSMEQCGNRNKVQSYRSRRSGGADGDASA